MTGKPGVIYLLKDRLQLYSPYLSQIVEFRFAPEMVRDSDVINGDLIETQIKAFVLNGKIVPSSLYILLADNAYFVKDYVLPTPPAVQKGAPPSPPPMSMETLQVMSLDFVEHVPYENVVSKTVPLKNGLKVIAVNKDFFDTIGGAFEKLGFKVEGVFPGLVLGNNLTTKPAMDPNIVNAVITRAGSLKEFDLQHQEVYTPAPRKGTETSVEMEIEDFDARKGKPDKKRLYMMLGVFGVLLIILVFVYQSSLESERTLTAAVPTNAPVATNPPALSPTVGPSEVSPTVKAGPAVDPEEAKLLTVQLTNTSAPAISFEKLRTTLGKFGFASVTSQSTPSLATSQTIIIFSILPSTEMRAAVLTEVKKLTPNVQIQEKADASTDITILLGK